MMKEKYIVFFMSKTKKKMIKFIEKQLQEKNIDDIVPSYGNILTVLYDHNQSLTMKEIGALLGKEKSTITTLVNKLEKLGYVKKVKRSRDQRTTYVCLTEKGLSIEKIFDEISAEVQNTAYHDFTQEERKEFLRLLKKMNQNFDT
ncbi:MarR family transcriptional regulator [uncultured Desulfobacter sp.]|uniref:MarR family winged helix-turn-helix transcriptional regulator n=1 Tax=uncultured Desulfobacter sp. TaxID=240139 RepID=UPI0029F4AF75|nr:MarR family transcriptional regulator [uncultured Desulfobacter sp.]